MWRALWPDGGAPTEGSDPEDLLQRMAGEQWASASRENIRGALAWRCHVLFNTEPVMESSARDFLIDVAQIGLFKLQIGPT